MLKEPHWAKLSWLHGCAPHMGDGQIMNSGACCRVLKPKKNLGRKRVEMMGLEDISRASGQCTSLINFNQVFCKQYTTPSIRNQITENVLVERVLCLKNCDSKTKKICIFKLQINWCIFKNACMNRVTPWI